MSSETEALLAKYNEYEKSKRTEPSLPQPPVKGIPFKNGLGWIVAGVFAGLFTGTLSLLLMALGVIV